MSETMNRMNINDEPTMGWLPDYPDIRDYSIDKNDVSDGLKLLGQKKSVKAMLKKIGIDEIPKLQIPVEIDLRPWCSPIENQQALGSCTAQAGIGLIEYYVRKVYSKDLDLSRLFLYKATRNLLGWTGDTGAFLRTTMGAMRIFGAPPEKYWPYDISKFEVEPPAFCYSFAKEFKAAQYFRLDPPSVSQELLLKRIKSLLAHGLPSMFGFTVYDSIRQASTTGKIPYPCPNDANKGGHAVVAVGYDDKMVISNMNCSQSSRSNKPSTSKGALLIRNSWGSNWGDEGYGWLPYDYVLNGLAIDWWCLLKNEWVDANVFGLSNVSN